MTQKGTQRACKNCSMTVIVIAIVIGHNYTEST